MLETSMMTYAFQPTYRPRSFSDLADMLAVISCSPSSFRMAMALTSSGWMVVTTPFGIVRAENFAGCFLLFIADVVKGVACF